MSFGKLAVLVLSCTIVTRAAAQEKHLKRSDLPSAVQKTVDAQAAGAHIRSYASETENGQLEYEVSMTVHGHSRDVNIAADGTVLEIEEQVALDSLPAPVRDGLKRKAGSGKIVKIESITKHGAIVAYEAQVHTGTKRSEFQVGPDGQPLAHEE